VLARRNTGGLRRVQAERDRFAEQAQDLKAQLLAGDLRSHDNGTIHPLIRSLLAIASGINCRDDDRHREFDPGTDTAEVCVTATVYKLRASSASHLFFWCVDELGPRGSATAPQPPDSGPTLGL